MSDKKQDTKPAYPSIAKVNDDDKAKAIQDEVRAELAATEANPDAAAAVEAGKTKKTGKKYRVMDSILEIQVGSIIPTPQSMRNQGDEVWSGEFSSKELEKRYLDAGAIEVWRDE